MTRSRRKTPIHGLTNAESEKRDKQRSHRKTRRRTTQAMLADPDEAIPPERHRDSTNPYGMDKDGKRRFDPEKYPEMMRK